MGCKAPREGHCEARMQRDKSDTRVLLLAFASSEAKESSFCTVEHRAFFIMLLVASRLVATCFQPVKESSRNSELFGIMGKKRRGGEKNGTVATG